MIGGYLWAIDQHGCPNRLLAQTKTSSDDCLLWMAAPCPKRAQIRRLAVSPRAVWALGSDGRTYLWIAASPVTIRVVEEVYENQRWYPLLGYTSKTLPTDRASWSTADGRRCQSKESLGLPSDGWVWEECAWTPDCSIHAADKLQHYKKAFVRRRRWVRTRKYAAVEKWIKLNERHNFFLVDISIGGLEIAGQQSGFMSIWAVTRGGRLLFREGVTDRLPEGLVWREVDGIKDDNGFDEEISVVSCSLLSGQLWVLSWDGRVFQRAGICGTNTCGSGWVELARPGRLAMLSVALGEEAVWAVTVEGGVRLWFATVTKPADTMTHALKESSWVQMTHTQTRVTVGFNDQVFGISLEDEQLSVRADISEKEPMGQSWKSIVCGRGGEILSGRVEDEVTDSAQSTVTNSYSSQLSVTFDPSTVELSIADSTGEKLSTFREEELAHSASELEIVDVSAAEIMSESFTEKDPSPRWMQVCAGACRVNSHSLPRHWLDATHSCSRMVDRSLSARQDMSSAWRWSIYSSLKTLNEVMEAVFGRIPAQAAAGAQWEKNSRCFVKADGKNKEAQVQMCIGDREQSVFSVQYNRQPQRIELKLKDLTAAVQTFDGSRHWVAFYTSHLCRLHKPLCVSLPTQEEQNSWISTLYQILFGYNSERKDQERTVVALTDQGHLMACKFDLGLKLCEQFWQPVAGHFWSVDVGYWSIVWAIGKDRSVWCLSPDFRMGYAEQFGANETQTDVETDYVYENQRHSALLGYIAFPGLMSGLFHAWSDEDGTQSCTKESVKLPSSDWHWLGDWSVDFNWDCDQEGWKFAKSFKGPFQAAKSFTKSRVRRRRWFRKRMLTCVAPWLPVDAPPLRCVSIQKDWNSDRPEILVWAVTTTGDVLCRTGVSRATPVGDAWYHVISDRPILAVAAGPKHTIWAIGEDGEAYVRYCANVSDILTCGWHEVPAPISQRKLVRIAVGDTSVWGVDGLGDLYVRQGVSEAQREGVQWQYVYSDVSAISVGPRDELFVTLKYSDPSVGKLSGVMAVRNQCCTAIPGGLLWDYGICGPWTHVAVAD